jgi:RNA polymerase sigma factor (sigma-70 family)
MLRLRMDPILSARITPEEVLQEASLRVRKRWPQFHRWVEQSAKHSDLDLPAMAYFWLNRIVRDCLTDAYRTHYDPVRDLHAQVRLPDGSSSQFALGLIDSGTSPTDELARKELQERVWQILGKLKPEDQQILWLRSIFELSTEEVTQVLEISKVNVRVRYGRAKLRFKDLWIAEYGTEGLEA